MQYFLSKYGIKSREASHKYKFSDAPEAKMNPVNLSIYKSFLGLIRPEGNCFMVNFGGNFLHLKKYLQYPWSAELKWKKWNCSNIKLFSSFSSYIMLGRNML